MYISELFEYFDPDILSGKEYPILFSLDAKTPVEIILLRILQGTLDIKSAINEETLKVRNNYLILEYPEVLEDNLESHEAFVHPSIPIGTAPDEVFYYFYKYNRANSEVFATLLFEISCYFFAKSRKSFIEGFVHLYRSLEYISISFPLMYATMERNYIATFEEIKRFMSSTSDGSNELKFFSSFSRNLFSKIGILSQPVDIFITGESAAQKQKLFAKLQKIIEPMNAIIDNGDYFTCQWKDVFTLTSCIRNRYFHMRAGTEYKNITECSFSISSFLEGFNDVLLNYISFIYINITKHRIEHMPMPNKVGESVV